MQKSAKFLYILALLKIIIPYLLQSSAYEPHRDEFLYLAEGHHLAWGFMEVPPLLSIFAWFTNVLGSNMFWIKLWPSLFGAATFLAAGNIVIHLGGKRFALFLLFLPFIFGAYLRLFFLFQPNAPEDFFWTMIAFGCIRFIQTRKNRYLYLAGVCTGLGMLSKYSVAFYAVAILLGILLTKHRVAFFRKHFVYAFLIGFIIFLPNLIWQYNEKFPIIFHMRKLQQTQLQYVNPAGFLADQLIMNFPCIFIWMAGLWYVSFLRQGKPYRFIGWAFLFVMLLLLAGRGKSYYALGVYPVLFAFGSFYLEQYTREKRRCLRYIFVLFAIAFGLYFIPILLPVSAPAKLARFYEKTHLEKTGLLKWEDLKNHPLPQDFSDMLGWEELAQKISSAYEKLDSNEKTHTILFCDNYGQAGAANFYARKYHLPQAYSDNASFLYWLPDSIQITNLVLVTDDQQEMQHPFIKNFSYAAVEDSVTNPFARERGSLVITLKGANEAFRQMFKKKIENDKAEFNY